MQESLLPFLIQLNLTAGEWRCAPHYLSLAVEKLLPIRSSNTVSIDLVRVGCSLQNETRTCGFGPVNGCATYYLWWAAITCILGMVAAITLLASMLILLFMTFYNLSNSMLLLWAHEKDVLPTADGVPHNMWLRAAALAVGICFHLNYPKIRGTQLYEKNRLFLMLSAVLVYVTVAGGAWLLLEANARKNAEKYFEIMALDQIYLAIAKCIWQ